MSDQPTNTPDEAPAGIQRVIMLGLAAMELVRGESDSVALDALLNAYVNTARMRGKLQGSAQVMMSVAQQLGATAKQPVPAPAPAAAAAAGYDADEIEAVRALTERLADVLHDQRSRVALSALLTMYVNVAALAGHTVPAAQFLVKTGEQTLAEHTNATPGDANVPPPPSPLLH